MTRTYSCRSRYCNQSFNSEGGLSKHRNTCAYYKRHEAEALQTRQKLVLEARAQKKAKADARRIPQNHMCKHVLFVCALGVITIHVYSAATLPRGS